MYWAAKFAGHLILLAWRGVVHLVAIMLATIALIWFVSSIFLLGPVGAYAHWEEGGSIWWLLGLYVIPWGLIGIIWLANEYDRWAQEQRNER